MMEAVINWVAKRKRVTRDWNGRSAATGPRRSPEISTKNSQKRLGSCLSNMRKTHDGWVLGRTAEGDCTKLRIMGVICSCARASKSCWFLKCPCRLGSGDKRHFNISHCSPKGLAQYTDDMMYSVGKRTSKKLFTRAYDTSTPRRSVHWQIQHYSDALVW